METSSLKKTAMVAAVAGTLAITAPSAQANVLNFSWTGAFTFLNQAGTPIQNTGSDYATGHYADGSGGSGSFGSPTTHGWNGYRTPISGTLSFDTSSGASVGTITPFQFFGDTPGSGPGTTVARLQNISFQSIDTLGTMVGTLLFSWNGAADYVSIVLDGSGLFANLAAMMAGGPTASLSGVGALPATNGYNFGSPIFPISLPLGPSPVATKTLNNGIESGFPTACDGQPIATQVNAYTIVGVPAVIDACTTGMVDDGIGGDPMTSIRYGSYNMNLDVTSVHVDSVVVPIPAAVWLFGSGLLGLIGLSRHKKKK